MAEEYVFGFRQWSQIQRLIEVELIEVDDHRVVAGICIVDESDGMACRPELGASRNPIFDNLLEKCILQPCVEMDIEFIDEVDRIGEVLTANKQVQEDIDNLLFTTAQDIVRSRKPATVRGLGTQKRSTAIGQ